MFTTATPQPRAPLSSAAEPPDRVPPGKLPQQTLHATASKADARRGRTEAGGGLTAQHSPWRSAWPRTAPWASLERVPSSATRNK